ncbi:MAG: phosphatase PAP2 family protein [candidate division WOR-3 bacterium]
MVIIIFILNLNLDNTITEQMDKLSSKSLDAIMKPLEDLTSFPIYTTVFYTLSLLGKEKEEKAVKLAVVALSGSSFLTWGIKGIVNRERPNKELTTRFNSSFPSGHMTNYFSVAHIFAKEYPRYSIYLYSFGFILGFSRIYLKKHYFTDVVAGMIIGISISEFIYKNKKYFNLIF